MRTTTAGYEAHAKATHEDSWGMPVAFTEPLVVDGQVLPGTDNQPYYPTPCCGASAKGLEHGIGCRKCYRLIDPSFGGVPVEPFIELEPAS